MRRNFSYEDLGAILNIREEVAYEVFWNLSFIEYELTKSWPKRLATGSMSARELDRMWQEIRQQDPFFMALQDNFKDPTGQGDAQFTV